MENNERVSEIDILNVYCLHLMLNIHYDSLPAFEHRFPLPSFVCVSSMSILSRVLPHFAHLVCGVPTASRLNVRYTTAMAKKTAILLIADGSEEIEAVVTVDVLRRAGVRFLRDITLHYIYPLT